MAKLTNWTKLLLISPLIAKSLAQTNQLKAIPLGGTEQLNCEKPNSINSDPKLVAKSSNLAWTYASNQQDYDDQKTHYFVFGSNAMFGSSFVNKLEDSVKLNENQNNNSPSISLTANSRDIQGVYACVNTGTKEVYAVYDVRVYSEPTVSLSSTALVAGQTGKITCEVANAWPEASFRMTVNNQQVDNIIISDYENEKKLKGYTLEANYDFDVNARQAEVSCTVSQKDDSISFWKPISAEEVFDVYFAPETPVITNYDQIRVGGSDQDNQIECTAEASPSFDKIEWQLQNLDQSLYNIIENGRIVTFNNVTAETHNNVSVICTVSNQYGSNQIAQQLTVIEPLSDYSIGGMGSNTVLVIGVVIAVIVLGLIGLFVTVNRKRTASRYETNETDKEASPEGVDYEQNPEREALAPEERDTKKELLM